MQKSVGYLNQSFSGLIPDFRVNRVNNIIYRLIDFFFIYKKKSKSLGWCLIEVNRTSLSLRNMVTLVGATDHEWWMKLKYIYKYNSRNSMCHLPTYACVDCVLLELPILFFIYFLKPYVVNFSRSIMLQMERNIQRWGWLIRCSAICQRCFTAPVLVSS